MAVQRFQIASLKDTEHAAKALAAVLRVGDVVTLAGDLGAGKTTFTQFLVGALSPVPVEVTSPTFTLLQTYPIRLAGGAECEFFHYDLYRIEHESALVELGLEEALAGVTLVEWPERLGQYFMPVSLALSLGFGKDGGREIAVLYAADHLKDLVL